MSETTAVKETKTETPAANAPKSDISFEVGFKGDKTRFDMRMIAVSEETELQQQFNDLSDSDDEKSAKEFEICKKALIRFSDGDASFIEQKFGAFNVKNERIIRKAYLMFKTALDPESSFL